MEDASTREDIALPVLIRSLAQFASSLHRPAHAVVFRLDRASLRGHGKLRQVEKIQREGEGTCISLNFGGI